MKLRFYNTIRSNSLLEYQIRIEQGITLKVIYCILCYARTFSFVKHKVLSVENLVDGGSSYRG